MLCPDCHCDLSLRSPAHTRRAGIPILRLACPECGGKFLATDAPYSHAYRTHRVRPAEWIKRVRSVRLSDEEMDAVETGRLRLVVVNRRITIAV